MEKSKADRLLMSPIFIDTSKLLPAATVGEADMLTTPAGSVCVGGGGGGRVMLVGGGGRGVIEGDIKVLGEGGTKVPGAGDTTEGDTKVPGVGGVLVEGVGTPLSAGETVAVASVKDGGLTVVPEGDKLSAGVVKENWLVGTATSFVEVGGTRAEPSVTFG